MESSQSGCRRRRGHHLTQSETQNDSGMCVWISSVLLSVHLQEEKIEKKTRVNEERQSSNWILLMCAAYDMSKDK